MTLGARFIQVAVVVFWVWVAAIVLYAVVDRTIGWDGAEVLAAIYGGCAIPYLLWRGVEAWADRRAIRSVGR